MPQTTSAKKALRVATRRRAINDRWRSSFRNLERKFKKALSEKQLEEARTLSVKLQSTVDRMARRHIVHRNTAARIKSRASARVAALGRPAAA